MKRKSRLFNLAMSVLMPPIGIVLLALLNLVYSQRNIETLARSYVENFTEIMLSRIERGGDIHVHENIPYEYPENIGGINTHIALGRLPGLLVVVDNDGKFIYGSERLREVAEKSGHGLPTGMATDVYDMNGERFTVCVFPLFFGKYKAIGGISWRDLPGATLRSFYLWPFLIGSVGLWSAISIWRLWREALLPFSKLEREISSLKWGEEIPIEDISCAVQELQQLRAAFISVAKEAISRVSVIRTCMNDLVSVQEAERTKISRDIHDGPLQDVTALIQRIHLAKLPDNAEEDTKRELELAEKIALVTVKEMRGLCDFLNPPWLELGLQQALTELTERQSSQYGVRIFLDVDENIEFSETITLAFFRVVQEAVTNSVRHGEAKNIWVDVKKDEKGFELCVQDDGHGFDMHENGTAALRVEGHRGLSNMEERMELVGGQLKIISYPGEGTCIRGFIP
ncbi:MAG: sensor histidine kinase [Synergistaceae bacterium]|nr:sensor histidine kinase [Synergistaceae bacterium]